MSDTLITFLVSATSVALFGNYLLDTFFNTPSPAQWTNVLRRKVLADSEFLFTRTDFEDYAREKFPFWLNNLISCRYCLSLHIMFWLTLVLCVFFTPFALFVPVWLVATGLANYLKAPEVYNEQPNTQSYSSPEVPHHQAPGEIRRNGVNMVRNPSNGKYTVVSSDPERETIVSLLKGEIPAHRKELSDIGKSFRSEIEKLLLSKPDCPTCEKNAIMDKHYEQMLKAYRNASTRNISQVSRPSGENEGRGNEGERVSSVPPMPKEVPTQ